VSARYSVIRVGWRSGTALAILTATGLMMFLWPLFWQPPETFAHTTDAPFIFLGIIPCLIAVVLSELHSGGLDSKAIAMLGVLSAVNAAMRPLGAGTAGVETVFFLLILAGRVYGPGFGFVLGSTSLFASALITGGVGPWLPFQMLASSWMALGAGLLPWPDLRGKEEMAMLCVYGAISAWMFGLLLNMWFWPFTIGVSDGTTDPGLSFVPGASLASNMTRFLAFSLATSTLGWDTGRAITNVVAIIVVGPAVLLTLRRSVRKAAWDAPRNFLPPATDDRIDGDLDPPVASGEA
jgi:energy-coupling factor transport system substrate-specific component